MREAYERAVRAAFSRPIAHRGLHAPGGPAENTVAAAEAAMRRGYGVECDVRLSRDGRAMVFHDERLKRMTGIDAALADLDAAELSRTSLHDGSAIPALADLLRALDGRVPLIIEIKGADATLCESVLAAIAGREASVLLEAFDPAAVARCGGAGCPVGLVGPSERVDSLAAIAALPRCDFLSWSVARLGEAAGHASALPLSTWTVRTPDQRAAAGRAGAQIVFEGFLP